MEELLNYTKYLYLICIYFKSGGNIRVDIRPHRKMNTSSSDLLLKTDIVNEELGLFVGNIFPTYFELQDKKDQLTETEKLALSSILNYWKERKLELEEHNKISFEASQIVFMLPIDWVEDRQTDMLRTLFLEAGWITPEDANNKLMLVPFIETFINSIQKTTDGRLQFGRERKYILFSVFQTDNWKNISYNYTSFQMQSAKELITVSKKLACSEILLVPTVLKSQSIKMLDLNDALRAAIKEILTDMQIRQAKKTQCVFKEEDMQEQKVSEIASKLANNLSKIYSCSDDHTKVVSDFVKGVDLDACHLQGLSNLKCHQLMKEISLNANVQEYTGEIADFMRNFCEEYGTLSHSPDGIQDIVLYYGEDLRLYYCFYISQALIQAKLVKPENRFIKNVQISTLLQDAAVQKPIKMFEIANAILPPVLLDDENIDNGTCNKIQRDGNSLLPLNSFYVQVTISEQQIDFILNKVVKEPSSKNTAQLFTIQQREIRSDSIMDVASDNMWNHYQLLESEGHLGLLSNCCQKHDTIELAARHYKCFNSDIKKLIEAWCQCKDTCTNEELDAYHPVYIDLHCTCALKITRRMLLDIGLTPAIINIGAIIIGAAFSNDYFGLYSISAIIIRKWTISVVNPYYSCPLERLLKETLLKGFQIHQRNPRLFFESDTDGIIAQYLGTGAYSQIASTTFAIKFHILSKRNTYSFGLHDEHRHLSQNLATRWRFNHRSKTVFIVTSDYIPILEKGSRLPQAGITKTFFLKEGKELSVLIYALDSSPNGITHGQITSMYAMNFFGSRSQISVNISPQHHTSSIKISLSRIVASAEVNRLVLFRSFVTKKAVNYYEETSGSIPERLHLKRQQEYIKT